MDSNESFVQMGEFSFSDSPNRDCTYELPVHSTPNKYAVDIHINEGSKRTTNVLPQTPNILNYTRGKSSSKKFLHDLLSYVSQKKNSYAIQKQNRAGGIRDIISDEYELEYSNLLCKLQKTHFTEEDKKYINVVNQLKQLFSQDISSTSMENVTSKGLPKAPVMVQTEACSMSVIQTEESTRADSHYETISSLEQEYDNQPTVSVNNRNNHSRSLTRAVCRHNTATVQSYSSYECITSFYNNDPHPDGTNDKKDKIYVQETITKQLLSFLQYGKNQLQGFVGSPAHLEAERLLVLTKTKSQIIKEFKASMNSITNQTIVDITINNIRCHINGENLNNQTATSHYVLILQHEGTVHASKVFRNNKLGWIDFSGNYIFKNINTVHKINAELYALRVSSKSFKRFFASKDTKLPVAKLIGKTSIDLKNAENQQFTFQHVEGCKYKPDNLTASVTIDIQRPAEVRFLTIGTKKPHRQTIPNRRWCILRNNELTYHTYPYRENQGLS